MYRQRNPIRNYFTRTAIILCTLACPSGVAHAQQSFAALRDTIAHAPNDTVRVGFMLEIGRQYYDKPGRRKADLDSAEYFFEEGRKIALRTRQHDNYLWSMYYLANAWIYMNQPWRATQIATIMGAEHQASVYANLCMQYVKKAGNFAHDIDSAILFGKMAFEVAKREKMPHLSTFASESIAAAYLENNQPARAMTLLPEMSDRGKVSVLRKVALAMMQKRDHSAAELDSAELLAYQSIKLGRSVGYLEPEPHSYYVLANVEIFRLRPERAARYVHYLVPVNKGEVCMSIANLYLRVGGNPDSARRYAELSREDFQAAKNKPQTDRAALIASTSDVLHTGDHQFNPALANTEQFNKMIAIGKKYESAYPSYEVYLNEIASNYIHTAMLIAEAMNHDGHRIEAWKEMAKVQCNLARPTEARKYIDLTNEMFRRHNNTAQIGATWYYYGLILRRQRVNYGLIADCYRRAREFLAQAGEHAKVLPMGLEEANWLQQDGRPEAALAVLQLLEKQFPNPPAKQSYDLKRYLANLLQLRGDLSDALRLSMAGLREAEQRKDTFHIQVFLTRQADIYNNLGQYAKSIDAYRRVHAIALKTGINYDHYAALSLTEVLIKHEGPQEAMKFVTEVTAKTNTATFYPTRLMEAAQALCYEAMGNTAAAEQHFLESVKDIDVLRVGDKLYTQLNYNIGRFYRTQQQYTIAAEYLRKSIRLKPDNASVGLTTNAHQLLSQCDSAMGNFRDALGHHQLFKYFNDSMFNVAQSRQISELHIQYETEKKDQSIRLQTQEILLNKQEIDLLTSHQQLQDEKLQRTELERLRNYNDAQRKGQDLQLKEKDIRFLTQQAKLKQSQLDKEILVRNVSFGGAGVLILMVALLVSGYRQKQKHNYSLQEKQVEIGHKNQFLEKLLKEKEWLLKEIHHRVKNNLQIIMSLLNGQSAYLQNDAALVAIRDSQHRVQAISLIHKKLYMSDNVGQINMPHYIHELVEYLIECYDTRHRVRFHIDIAPLQIDVSQAVPLGLILNEAITNSIKYAFPENGEGMIAIHLEPGDDGHYALTIADNGKGLPDDFQIGKCNSLGMSLMQGLSDDLGGEFSIRNRDGVEICIRFANDTFAHPVLSPHQENTVA